MRRLITLSALALALSATGALAGPTCRCGGGGSGRQGGPLARLVHRVQERREVRTAGVCSSTAVAFPAAAPPSVVSAGLTYPAGDCPGGRCPVR